MEEFMLALKLMYEIISYILVPVLIICFFMLLDNVIQIRKNIPQIVYNNEYEKALFFWNEEEIIKFGEIILWGKIIQDRKGYVEDKILFIKEVDEILKNLSRSGWKKSKSVEIWRNNLSIQ